MKEEIIAWFKKAQHDLKTSKYNLDGGIFDAAIFYAQQSAEKALKSLIIKKTGSFPKIHDLTRLAKLAEAPAEIIKLCAKVNPAYTASRYPDDIEDYNKEDCQEIINDSEDILEWAQSKIG